MRDTSGRVPAIRLCVAVVATVAATMCWAERARAEPARPAWARALGSGQGSRIAQNGGSFARRAVIPAPHVDFVRVADLDGNGRPDFLTIAKELDGSGDPAGSRTEWWPQGDPGEGERPGFEFPSAPESLTGAPRDIDVRVGAGDVDGDDHQDVLSLRPDGRLTVWLNLDGSGTFANRTIVTRRLLSAVDHLEVADVDGDGMDDLLLVRSGQDLHWIPSTGSVGAVSFGAQQRITTLASGRLDVTRLDAGDLNGDGRIDLVTSNRVHGLIAWWHQALDEAGDFRRVGEGREPGVRDVALGDLDGDGANEVLVTAQNGNQPYEVFAWWNDGGGVAFTRGPDALSASATRGRMWGSIDTADVNGDGHVDFVASEFGTQGHLCWYENPGPPAAPSATPATDTPAATSTSTATVQTPRATPTTSPTLPAPTSTATPTGSSSATAGTPGGSATPPYGSTATTTPTVPSEVRIFLPIGIADRR